MDKNFGKNINKDAKTELSALEEVQEYIKKWGRDKYPSEQDINSSTDIGKKLHSIEIPVLQESLAYLHSLQSNLAELEKEKDDMYTAFFESLGIDYAAYSKEQRALSFGDPKLKEYFSKPLEEIPEEIQAKVPEAIKFLKWKNTHRREASEYELKSLQGTTLWLNARSLLRDELKKFFIAFLELKQPMLSNENDTSGNANLSDGKE